MPFQPVVDGIEVVLKAVQNGVPIVNVYNVQDTETHDAARLGEIADVFHTWWVDNLKPILNNSYVLQSITATNLTSSAGPQVVRSYTTGNQGDLTGEQVAGNAALVISWRTALIGRSFRGRTYVGGLDGAATDTAQNVSSAFASAIGTSATNLIDALNTAGAALAVLSRFVGGVLRVAGLLTEIISVIVDTKIDSQRRRTAN